MTSLLDTHFLIWITLDSKKLRHFTWLGQYQPWGVSPVSLLEIQFLAEIGRIQAKQPALFDALLQDRRFVVDEVPLGSLIRQAFGLSWTRDPFDRLLAAHSIVRGIPLCTVDEIIVGHHPLLLKEVTQAA